MTDSFETQVLDYHRVPRPGKIEVMPTKPLANQQDLALAYSPGVAIPSQRIADDPALVAEYTARSNLVAVVTNGTAVLGLGDIGPLAAKPVMEGKGVLFKKFAGIDVFDIEISERDPQRLIDIVASLEPTFGGINLEDIKSPECFAIEQELSRRMKIPVFHDDQHGTAIIASAALLNAVKIVGKPIEELRLVCSGAGAAASACLTLFLKLGLRRENVIVVDRSGVLRADRPGVAGTHKAEFATHLPYRTLAEALDGADAFLGVSVAGMLTPDMLRTMAPKPIVLALANPVPEIMPEVARQVRPDAVVATGRSDYPNQVNNVLCFPYLFRGALDVGATFISDEMKMACVHALADLTMQEANDLVIAAYGVKELKFGPDYLIPKPFDPRLIQAIAPAVAAAAMKSGVATRPIADLEAYRADLSRYVFQSVLLMQPLFNRAKQDRKRLIYTNGEEPQILRAVQTIVDEKLARPMLIGHGTQIAARVAELGLRLTEQQDYDVVEPPAAPTGVTELAAQLVRDGRADALLCGYKGLFAEHLADLDRILGRRAEIDQLASMNVLVLRKGTYFVCDGYVNQEPNAKQIADIALLAAEQIRRFGILPRAALVLGTVAGSANAAQEQRLRDALVRIRAADPNLEIDGPLDAETALTDSVRRQVAPESPLRGPANLLIMPNREVANITIGLLTVLGTGVTVGPILLGCRYPAHILTPTATVRRIINMSTLAVVDSQPQAKRGA